MSKTKQKWIRYSCPCGATLEVKAEAAGSVKKCPSCEQEFQVPVRLEELPQPMPNLPLEDYVRIATAILEATFINCDVMRRLGRRDDFRRAKKDGKRAMHCVVCLARDAIEASITNEMNRVRRESPDSGRVVEWLSENALAQEFRGVSGGGERKKRKSQFRRWLRKLEDATGDRIAMASIERHSSSIAFIEERQREVGMLRFNAESVASHS